MTAPSTGTVLTIGHSNRQLQEFISMLHAHRIGEVVDVRAFPGSRRQPHFGSELLAGSLATNGIEYQHLRALGGRRRLPSDADPSEFAGWRNASFQAYAHHVQTDEYHDALDALMSETATARVAIMCSEAVPWRCHRWLISDTLLARGWRVLHAMDERSAREHILSSFARVDGNQVTWPGPPSSASLRLGPPAQIGEALAYR
jgi:uncharacterized protein (DUF488 family)